MAIGYNLQLDYSNFLFWRSVWVFIRIIPSYQWHVNAETFLRGPSLIWLKMFLRGSHFCATMLLNMEVILTGKMLAFIPYLSFTMSWSLHCMFMQDLSNGAISWCTHFFLCSLGAGSHRIWRREHLLERLPDKSFFWIVWRVSMIYWCQLLL